MDENAPSHRWLTIILFILGAGMNIAVLAAWNIYVTKKIRSQYDRTVIQCSQFVDAVAARYSTESGVLGAVCSEQDCDDTFSDEIRNMKHTLEPIAE